MYKLDKKYYVYEWFNVVTGEVFYVGKGIRNRYCQLSGRNQYFIDYFNTHECESRIVYENLTEQEAYEKEKELIKYYRETSNFRLTNVTDGGEGNPFKLGELNPKFGKGEEIKGEKNPFYGQKHTERVKKILSQKARLRVGELNSFLVPGNLYFQQSAGGKAAEADRRNEKLPGILPGNESGSGQKRERRNRSFRERGTD